MFNNYKCPTCKGQLRFGDHIVLTAFNDAKHGSIIFLHAELGNYSIDFHPDIEFTKGEKVKFVCPICHKDLSSKKHKNLALLCMTDNEGKEFDIYFSQITGEHSTIKMVGEHAELFGPHSDKYLDFFSMSQLR